MTDVNIIPNKYKNIVIITAAEELNINENYWGYSASNRISWVEKLLPTWEIILWQMIIIKYILLILSQEG